MTKQRPNTTTPIAKATLATGLFLLAHLLLAHWQSPYPFWGLDLLTYHPTWLQIPFALFASLLLLPPARDQILQLFKRLSPLLDHRTGRAALSFILILALAILFYFFRSAVHLLGDGYLYLRELDNAVWNELPRVDRAPLTFWITRTLHNLGGSAQTTYRIYSFASGLFYLALIFPIARTLGRNRTESIATGAFLLSAGFLQLFCGYVENYALLLPALLLYFLAGLRALQNQLSPWIPALALAFFLPLHFAFLAFLPSLALLLWLCEKPTGLRSIIRASAPLVTLPLIVLTILFMLGIHPFAYFKKLASGHLLPLFSEPDFYQPYRLFSLAHLLDVLNQQLLVAPAACLTIFLIRKQKSLDPPQLFLLTATLFSLLFTFLANPEIGAFRDWDILVLPALPFSLWAARRIAVQNPDRNLLAHIALLLVGAAALHTALWIGLNANPTAAEHRYKNLLQNSQLSKHAGSYGWETLGIYYRNHNKLEHALEAYQQAIKASPNPRHWFSTGTLQSTLGRKQEAIESYQKAIALKSDFAEAYSNLGNTYQDLKQYENAIASFQKSVDLNPNFADAYSNLGNALQAIGRTEDAIVYFQEAVAHKPDFAEARYNLGNVFLAQGQFEKAIPHYRQAIQINPNLSGAYYNLGNAYYNLSQFENALKNYLQALSLEPGLAEACFAAGNAYYGLGRFDDALKYYQKTIALKPDFLQVHARLGDIHFMAGRFDDAARAYQQVVALDPNFADGHANLANALLQLKRHEEALVHYRKAIAPNPKDVNTLYNLAVLYHTLNQIEEASHYFQKVLDHAPNHPQAPTIRAWLRTVGARQ
ncbi:MAG: tetratricopeptide repeat protein, partial [bacterium]|nr:tetratricopeptide repeat protein [bacterium]